MEVHFDESDLSACMSTEESNDNELSSQGLELRAVSTNEELDSALDEIPKDLQTSLQQNVLNVNPDFAFLDASNLTSSQKQAPSDSPSDDTSAPMSIGDYDVYDFASQVKA